MRENDGPAAEQEHHEDGEGRGRYEAAAPMDMHFGALSRAEGDKVVWVKGPAATSTPEHPFWPRRTEKRAVTAGGGYDVVRQALIERVKELLHGIAGVTEVDHVVTVDRKCSRRTSRYFPTQFFPEGADLLVSPCPSGSGDAAVPKFVAGWPGGSRPSLPVAKGP